MKKIILNKVVLPALLFFLYSPNIGAQTPGLITVPKNGNGVTILNPNGDRWSSQGLIGFKFNDISESEIPYKVIPPMISEAISDISNGPTGGFTDIVSTVDGSGFYAHSTGTHILFRFRLGSTNNGSKAYSVLLDTDMKIGGTGLYADPNFIAGDPGNPGFEYEIVYFTNGDVVVYNVDGKTTGTIVGTFSSSTHAQQSVALSKSGGDADYFYDFGVPITSIGSPLKIRMVASSIIAPQPGLVKSPSDVYGIDDATIKSLHDTWKKIIDAQCGFNLSDLAGTSPLCATCTQAPTITSVSPVTNTVTGMWKSLDPSKPNTATISLYRNNVLVGTTTATSGSPWSITLASLFAWDDFTAKAKATNESECLFSPTVKAGCNSLPVKPKITCATNRGISGTIPLGTTINIYEVVTGTATPTTPLTLGLIYIDNPTNRTFEFYSQESPNTNPCTGGVPDVNDGTYMLQTNAGGCISQATFICISGGSYTLLATNGIMLATPILSTQKSVSGSSAVSGQTLRLYINGLYAAGMTASGTTFTFNNLSLKTGDQLIVSTQTSSAGSCMTLSNPYNVTCALPISPRIKTTRDGYLLSTDTKIDGTSTDIGHTIHLYKGLPNTGVLVGTTSVTANGTWVISPLTLAANENYYATQVFECEGAASSVTVVLDPTTICGTISGTYNDEAMSVIGTTTNPFTGIIRLYLDGQEIGSTNLSNSTTWAIPVNTTTVNKIYTESILSVTTQAPGFAENTTCNSIITVQCSVPPVPDVTPTSVTIFQGQSVTFRINNPDNQLLYSIWDNAGSNYATSLFGAGTSSMTIPSQAFDTPGTYNLFMINDKLYGRTCRNQTPLVVTVNAVVLPVKFISFTIKKNSERSRTLNWTVSHRQEISHYEVQRSNNCNSFISIASIANQNPSDVAKEFSINDDDFTSGTYCYRIKAISIDGRVIYSTIISINDEYKFRVNVAPNPANSETTISLDSHISESIMMELIDLTGRVIMKKQFFVNEGKNLLVLNNLKQFQNGQYIIKISSKSKIDFVKFQINKF